MAEEQDIIIRLLPDRTSANQTEATITRVKNSIRAAFDGNATTKFQGNIKSLNKDLDELRKSIGKAADEKNRLESSGGGGSSSSNAGSKLLGAAGRAGSAVSSGLGSALRDVQDIQEFGQSLSDISPKAVAAGIGIGAATVALAALQAQAQKVKDAAAAELSARSEVIGFIQTATQAEIQAKIDELKQKQVINQAIANDANSVRDQVESQTNAIGKLNAALGTNQTELTAAREAADKANKAVNENATALALLQQAADAGFASERDYAEAIQKTNDERAKASIAGANDEYNRQLKLQQDQLLNSSQLFAKVTQSIQEQNAAQAALNQLQQGYTGGNADIDKQITEFQLKIARSGADITRYYDLIAQRKPIEDAIKNQEDLAKAQADAQKEIDKINADSQAALAKKNEDIAALNDKLAQSLDDLAASFAQENLDAAIKQQQQLADIVAKNAQDQADAQTSLNDDLIKIREDYVKRVQEIEKQYSRSSADAIQDRNAVALDAAKRQRDDDLGDAKAQRDDDTRARQDQYRRQLRDLQTNLVRQIAEQRAAFARDNADRQQKYDRDRQQLISNNQREIDQRNQAYTKQLSDLSKYLTQRSQTEQGYFGAILTYAKQVKDNITNLLNGGNSAVVSGAVSGGNASSALGGIFGFGAGRSTGGTSSKTNAGVFARSAAAGAAAGGVNINVNGLGVSRTNVIREVTRQLNDFYDGYDRAN